MTHALHREGSIKSLRGDYVLLAMVSRANRETAGPAMARFAQIALGADPTNYGSSTFALNRPLGLQPEDFIRRAPEADGVACVFTSKEELRQVLVELKEADLGLSITVSGLTDEVLALAREVGLKPHSVELSLGDTGRHRPVGRSRVAGGDDDVWPLQDQRRPDQEGGARGGGRASFGRRCRSRVGEAVQLRVV